MSKNINSFYYCYHDFGSRRGTKGYELKKKKKKKKKKIKKKKLKKKKKKKKKKKRLQETI